MLAGPNFVTDARTNALVLEAIAFQAHGPLLAGWTARRGAALDRWARALPPARPLPPPAAPPAAASPAAPPAPTIGTGPGWRPVGEQVSGQVAFGFPLGGGGTPGAAGAATTRAAGAAAPPSLAYASATVNWNPVSAWFARLTAYRFLDPAARRPWDPDFSYVLGYDDWRPGTPSLIFMHYGGNRWDGTGASPLEGTLQVAQKLPALPEWPAGIGAWSGQVAYGWTPRYTDAAGATWANKHALSARADFVAWEWLRLWVSPHWYLAGAQQPWDPDYTFGVGLAHWRPWTLGVSYANYAGTRFPWRAPASGAAGLADGSLIVTGNWAL
jgi:hypothetical protein